MLKAATLSIFALSLVACGSTPPNHFQHAQFDIARMQPDCRNADIMINWAERQLEQASLNLAGNELRSYRGSVMNFIWETKEKCK